MTSERSRAAIRHILDDPAWRGILKEFIARYRAYGRVCGRYRLKTTEEAEAVRSVFGHEAPRIGAWLYADRLDRKLLEKATQCTLQEMLEAFNGRPLVSTSELRNSDEDAWSAALEKVGERAGLEGLEPLLACWLVADGRYLRQQWRAAPDEFMDAVIYSLRLGAEVTRPNPPLTMLALIAARLTPTPKGYDRNTLAGRLVLRLLATLKDGRPQAVTTADQRAELFRHFLIDVDDVSSHARVSGIQAGHSLAAMATHQGKFYTFSLYDIHDLGSVRVAGNRIWMVENATVFSDLFKRSCKISAEMRPCIVLASGRPSLAVQRLIDRMMATPHRQLFYSSDNDQYGLEMLTSWQLRYPGRVRAWGMATQGGLAPVEVSRHSYWQENLVDHLWLALLEESRAVVAGPPLAVLGLSEAAPGDAIRRAWRRLVHVHHPDKGGDAEAFKAIQNAFECLRDRV